MTAGAQTFGRSVRRIAPLAWPVFVGQIAVLAFATVDTVLAGRYGAVDLAALAIGGAAYGTVFVGLMGVVLAVSPIVGQLYGAGRLDECARQLQQAMWLALLLSVVGSAVLLFPEPFLRLSQASPAVAAKVRAHLAALAFALPPALLFTAFRGFNTAVSRPKTVMVLQLGALACKLPLTALLVFGLGDPAGPWHLAGRGAPGCGMATAVLMWLQFGAGLVVLRRDPFYRQFRTAPAGRPRRWVGIDRASFSALLRLGVPMGLSIAIEVAGFTFMAFFIARLGTTPVAGHQIAVNLVSMMFMMPFSIANAASTLVAQRVGAADPADARRVGWHGLELGVAIAALLGGVVYGLRREIVGLYTHDAVVVAAALPLLAWLGVFHVADAAQTISAVVLRAYRIATAPLVIYAVAIWGIGIGGGYSLAFDVGGWAPASLQGAPGFWSAATAGLTVAAVAMTLFLRGTMRRQRRRPAAAGVSAA